MMVTGQLSRQKSAALIFFFFILEEWKNVIATVGQHQMQSQMLRMLPYVLKCRHENRQ